MMLRDLRVSGLILLACALAIAANGLNFGIDFESGTRITAALERAATVEEVRDAIGPAGFGDAEVQTLENPELGENVIQVSAEESGRTPQVTDALDDAFGLSDEPNVQGMRRFHEALAAEPRVSATVIQTVGSKGYDGLAIALVVEDI